MVVDGMASYLTCGNFMIPLSASHRFPPSAKRPSPKDHSAERQKRRRRNTNRSLSLSLSLSFSLFWRNVEVVLVVVGKGKKYFPTFRGRRGRQDVETGWKRTKKETKGGILLLPSKLMMERAKIAMWRARMKISRALSS